MNISNFKTSFEFLYIFWVMVSSNYTNGTISFEDEGKRACPNNIRLLNTAHSESVAHREGLFAVYLLGS